MAVSDDSQTQIPEWKDEDFSLIRFLCRKFARVIFAIDMQYLIIALFISCYN